MNPAARNGAAASSTALATGGADPAAKAEAIAGAGRVYAEAIARQDARTPREAAREALGRDATDAQLDAWIAEFRPSPARRQTA